MKAGADVSLEPAELRRVRRAIESDLRLHVDRFVTIYGKIPEIESEHMIDRDGVLRFTITLKPKAAPK